MSAARSYRCLAPSLRSLGVAGRAPIGAVQATRCFSTALGSKAFPSSSIAATSPALKKQPAYIQTRNYAAIPFPEAEISKTGLYDLHLAHEAKMVPFGGFMMPVQYSSQSVGDSHAWTREKASLFDVSHMVQYHISGRGAKAFLERITPADLKALNPHHSTLSALLHPTTGGICDDMIITRLGPTRFYVVTNAGCRAKDRAFLDAALTEWSGLEGRGEVEITELKHQGLVALQGPLSAPILRSALVDPSIVDLDTLTFGTSQYINIRLPDGSASEPCLASRGGYTGEDGFEISIPPHQTVAVTEALLGAAPDTLRLAGLGARDSLRLEAGMCLYGHDLDDTTTPVEANLRFIIAKARRATGGFNGDKTILAQLQPKAKPSASGAPSKTGVSRQRIGLIVEGSPAREGAQIVKAGTEEVIGTVTSGCPSPTLGKNIAMGYVAWGEHQANNEVGVLVRGKVRKAHVVKMPFVKAKYWRGSAGTQ